MVVEILHLTGTSRKVPVYASKKKFQSFEHTQNSL